MLLKTDTKIIASILILLAAAVLTAACGKKAPPRPPSRETAPATVGNLGKAISGDVLSLTWGPVAKTAAENLAGFYVFRSKTRLTDSICPGCPILFERVAVVPFRAGAAPGPIEYREKLDSGYRYIYKVAAYTPGGVTGKDSDTIEFSR